MYQNPTWVATVSAGNAGPLSGSDPATAKNVLSMGATFLGEDAYIDGSRGILSSAVMMDPTAYAATTVVAFTSRGPWADGRRAPLVCAPGV